MTRLIHGADDHPAVRHPRFGPFIKNLMTNDHSRAFNPDPVCELNVVSPNSKESGREPLEPPSLLSETTEDGTHRIAWLAKCTCSLPSSDLSNNGLMESRPIFSHLSLGPDIKDRQP
ncbi:MAG: hypothetical protein M2R45_02582 [Verrucomicrobia subdivision 3 bacterium]|nr:hypothetical protein [Limisphaerales bacterium]MCS1416448.1 hypothetical protein [Limisphaerales bacterium]